MLQIILLTRDKTADYNWRFFVLGEERAADCKKSSYMSAHEFIDCMGCGNTQGITRLWTAWQKRLGQHVETKFG